MNKGTYLRLGTAIGAITLAGLAIASPGFAHDPDGKHDGKKVEKVIIIGDHVDGDRVRSDGRIRTFHVDRMNLADCRGGDRTVRESNDKGEKTKVIICRRDGPHAGAGGHGAHGGHGGHGGHADGGHADGGPRVRAFAMHGGELADCLGGERQVTETNEGGKHGKVIICSRGGAAANPAQRVERLEQALSRLTSSDQLTAEQKERVTAALREAIERLRTTP